ncbi:uncharacterized protein LOC127727284 [Mytilus californianus]|uniref:uncharacterized protein LOC127727284 n=1 Tax=Mytilus californianus TaxID=6549 RepID=UPI002245BCA6|nr:uncharacterized protein LOC127727284 [Mytilus californianus]
MQFCFSHARYLAAKRAVIALSVIVLFYFIIIQYNYLHIDINLKSAAHIPDVNEAKTTFKFTPAFDGKSFLTSAIYTNLSNCLNHQDVIVNGWEYNVKNNNFICCFRLKNGKPLDITSNQKLSSIYAHMPLRRIQYRCPVQVEFNLIEYVSIVNDMKATCQEDISYYVKVSLPLASQDSSIAICSLISYRSQDAAILVEWFEAQRLLGVNKIVTYTQELNSDALRVLDYYESIGLAYVIREFDMPEKDKLPRFLGEQNARQWTDKEVVSLDCNARLLGFKYVIMCDKDEFVVPNFTKFGFSLRKALDQMFDIKTAGVQLNPKVHVTTWIPDNRSSTLFINKYLNSTTSIADRHKYIYMPQRTVVGSTTIHSFTACRGYKRYTAMSTVLDFHHYRSCANSFVKYQSVLNREKQTNNIEYHGKNTGNVCADFKQHAQSGMKVIGKQIEKNVLEVRKQLGIAYQ